MWRWEAVGSVLISSRTVRTCGRCVCVCVCVFISARVCPFMCKSHCKLIFCYKHRPLGHSGCFGSQDLPWPRSELRGFCCWCFYKCEFGSRFSTGHRVMVSGIIHVMVRTLRRDYSIMQVLIRRKYMSEQHNTLTQADVGEACMDEYIFYASTQYVTLLWVSASAGPSEVILRWITSTVFCSWSLEYGVIDCETVVDRSFADLLRGHTDKWLSGLVDDCNPYHQRERSYMEISMHMTLSETSRKILTGTSCHLGQSPNLFWRFPWPEKRDMARLRHSEQKNDLIQSNVLPSRHFL